MATHLVNRNSSHKILVTGGAGFIGSQLVRSLLARGHQAIVLDALTYAGMRENLDDIPGQIVFCEGDICDLETVRSVFETHRPTAVMHLAAESHVDRSIEGPGAFVRTNVLGTAHLLIEASRYFGTLPSEAKEGFRFVHVSTDEVFGALGPTGYFSESTKYDPRSPYSASKAGSDHLARAWFHTYGLPVIVTNCSNNYGPRQFPEKLIPRMIRAAVQGLPLPVYGQGENIRDWIHVEDHCSGLILALERGTPGETYLFGGRAERKNIDVVKTVCRILDELKPRTDGKKHDDSIAFVKDRLGHDFRYAIDDRHSEEVLGFKRRHHFESGLFETVRWYLNNELWCQRAEEKNK